MAKKRYKCSICGYSSLQEWRTRPEKHDCKPKYRCDRCGYTSLQEWRTEPDKHDCEDEKSIEITIRTKGFKEAPEEHHFVTKDGEFIRDIFELGDAFAEMSEDVFKHHVNEARNDFATWVRDVFNEEQLAQEFEGARTRAEHEVRVLRKIIRDIVGAL